MIQSDLYSNIKLTKCTEHRNDISYSARYAQLEDQFIKIAQGEGTGEMKEKIFKLNKMEKDLLDNFQTVKNNALLWQKTTMDVNGKSTVLTEDGRPECKLGAA